MYELQKRKKLLEKSREAVSSLQRYIMYYTCMSRVLIVYTWIYNYHTHARMHAHTQSVCMCICLCVCVVIPRGVRLSRYVSRYINIIEIKIIGFVIEIIVNFWILLYTTLNIWL